MPDKVFEIVKKISEMVIIVSLPAMMWVGTQLISLKTDIAVVNNKLMNMEKQLSTQTAIKDDISIMKTKIYELEYKINDLRECNE